MNRHTSRPFVSLTLVLLCPLPLTAASRVVEMEIRAAAGIAPTAPHEWAKVLQQLPATRVRIVRGGRSTKPSVHRPAGETAPLRVTGILESKNRLRLPGGVFAQHQIAELKQWHRELIEPVEQSSDSTLAAFGLNAEQLVELYDTMSLPLQFSTRNKSRRTILGQTVKAANIQIDWTKSAANQVRSDRSLVQDELQGVSIGTSLAALLNPLDLVVVPDRHSGATRLIVRPRESAERWWPVGWPPEEANARLVPKLIDSLDIEIDDVPLADVLVALEQRLQVPLLVDHAELSKRGIDLESVRVSYPNSRVLYRSLLSRVLFKARLKSDVRVDEAGRAFIWVAPVRPQ